MHASIPTTYVSLIFLYILFFSLFFLFFSFSSSSSFRPLFSPPSPSLLFTATLFYTICHGGIYHSYSSTTFRFLWVSFQNCPLVCQLLSHYHCSKCVGCTTLHSQTKLLALFLTSLYFSLPSFG